MSQKAAEEYRASLESLETNAKIEINALTMLAEDYSEFAVDIAACIENRLKNVAKSRKLPILYLIDSICKNFPNSKYVELFTQNIVSNFCNVFQVSDEKVRRSLHKLRMTWNETKTFPKKKLNAIDERVHAMDPNWPILDKSIANNTRSNTVNNNNNNNADQPIPPPVMNASNIMHNNLQHSNKGNNNNNNINNTTTNTNSSSNNSNNNVNNNANNQRRRKKLKLQAAPVAVVAMGPTPMVVQPTIHLDPTITSIASPQSLQPTATIVPAPLYPSPLINSDHPIPQTVLTAADPQQYQHHHQQHQHQPQQQQHLHHQQHHHHHQQQQPHQQQQLQHSQQPFVENSILDSLYGGKQCSNCSLRFEENGNYDNHLDWHFRQNRCDRYPRRQWYYPLELWIQFRDINDEAQHQENDEVTSTPNYDDGEIPTATASKEDSLNICPVCQETFEKFWAEEEEEWRLRKATLYEERVYHPNCLKDLLAR